MKQLEPVIKFVKKNWFWLTSGLLAALVIGAWFPATDALRQAQETDTSTLNSKISELEGVMKVSAEGVDPTVKVHPNAGSQKGMDERMEAVQKEVVAAWKMRYDAQKPLMVWPEEVLKTPEFIKFFSSYTFPEAEANIPQEKAATYLQMYTREIPRRMEKICAMIGVMWDREMVNKALGPAAGAPAGRAGQGGPKASSTVGGSGDQKLVVLWNSENQKLWLDKLTKFEGYDGNAQKFATAYQVFALQQDLWLLEAMFKVIKQVNGEADANHIAAIREIDHLVFGREARGVEIALAPIDKRLADASVSDAALGSGAPAVTQPPSEDEVQGRNSMRAPPAAAASGAAAKFPKDPPAGFETRGPFHGRYLKPNFEPVPANELQDVLGNKNGLPAQNLELVVARRIPFRIALKMQENKIAEFVAACANSPFGFEINQIRVNRHKPGEGIELYGGAKTTGGAAAPGRDGRDQPSAAMGGGAGAGGTGLDGGGGEETSNNNNLFGVALSAAEKRSNMVVAVEFSGIVKLYNPVDENRLKGGGEAAPAGGQNTAAAGGGGSDEDDSAP